MTFNTSIPFLDDSCCCVKDLEDFSFLDFTAFLTAIMADVIRVSHLKWNRLRSWHIVPNDWVTTLISNRCFESQVLGIIWTRRLTFHFVLGWQSVIAFGGLKCRLIELGASRLHK